MNRNTLYVNGLCNPILLMIAVFSIFSAESAEANQDEGLKFEVSYPAETNPGPLTGRAIVIISDRGEPQPMRQTGGDLARGVPIWGKNFSKPRT